MAYPLLLLRPTRKNSNSIGLFCFLLVFSSSPGFSMSLCVCGALEIKASLDSSSTATAAKLKIKFNFPVAPTIGWACQSRKLDCGRRIFSHDQSCSIYKLSPAGLAFIHTLSSSKCVGYLWVVCNLLWTLAVWRLIVCLGKCTLVGRQTVILEKPIIIIIINRYVLYFVEEMYCKRGHMLWRVCNVRPSMLVVYEKMPGPHRCK